MIKIDGDKIKKLREDQGLTQLYMATAVEVTTDTISRWENRRYPSIKEENAAKLAETLGVALEDILLFEDDHPREDDAPPEREPGSLQPPVRSTTWRRRSLFFGGALLILAAVVLAWRYYHHSTGLPELKAVRIMPPRTIPGAAFPVVVEITQTSSTPRSIIVKEFLPEGCEVLQVSPPEGSATDAGQLKWIHRLQGKKRFSYLAKIEGTPSTAGSFSGTVSTAESEESIAISGKNMIKLGRYHWADLDGDATISDKEILTVFDYYSDIDNFAIDIEFIEKMWLGSRYSWDEEKNLISISP